MKRGLLALALVWFIVGAFAAVVGPVQTVDVAPTPGFACTHPVVVVYKTTGAHYACVGGVWTAVGTLGGGATPSGADMRLAFWDTATTLASDVDLTWDATARRLEAHDTSVMTFHHIDVNNDTTTDWDFGTVGAINLDSIYAHFGSGGTAYVTADYDNTGNSSASAVVLNPGGRNADTTGEWVFAPNYMEYAGYDATSNDDRLIIRGKGEVWIEADSDNDGVGTERINFNPTGDDGEEAYIDNTGAYVGIVDSASATIKTVEVVWLPAAACNGGTGVLLWDYPATGDADAACTAGTYTLQGTADFDTASSESIQTTIDLPADYDATVNVTAKIKWFAAATSGNVKWDLATVCASLDDSNDGTWNTASTVTTDALGTTNEVNVSSIAAVTMTNCAAADLLHLKLSRDVSGDNMSGDARLIGVLLTFGRSQ